MTFQLEIVNSVLVTKHKETFHRFGLTKSFMLSIKKSGYVDFQICRFVGFEISESPDRVVMVSVVVGDVELFRTTTLTVRAPVNLPKGLVQLNKVKVLMC